MSTGDVARRASYGPTSPVVGERGAQTRQAIVGAALALFEERGFHATMVDDIAAAVGVSRATLYQYFESKEHLFVELVNASGAAMMRVVRRLGTLGPTTSGYDNLHWWVGEWSWVYDKYSTMYVQWANVDSPRAPLRPMILEFMDRYVAATRSRIAEAGVGAIEPDVAAVVLLAVLNRTNYYRHTTTLRGRPDAEVLDTLATVVQLMLFPDTPPGAIRAGGAPDESARTVSTPGARRRRPQQTVRAREPRSGPDRRENMSGRVQSTVRQLLDAGAWVFATRGYRITSIDEIISEAGLGRGTFYKYFLDKLDLLTTLAGECADALSALAGSFAELDLSHAGAGTALRSWLAEFIELHDRYSGVMRVWLEGEPRSPALDELGEQVSSAVLAALDDVLGRVERAYPFSVPAGSMILLAVIERVPDQLRGTRYELGPADLTELVASLIERGLLNGSAVSRPRPRGE